MIGTGAYKNGVVSAEPSHLHITFRRGHSDIDPCDAAIDFHLQLRTLVEDLKSKGHTFNFSLPVLHIK
jgi:hypothetical protein